MRNKTELKFGYGNFHAPGHRLARLVRTKPIRNEIYDCMPLENILKDDTALHTTAEATTVPALRSRDALVVTGFCPDTV